MWKRFKISRDRYSKLLNSFSISNKSWTNITMNFVIELFLNKEYNVILMIINKLIKIRHYIFCTTKKKHFLRKNNLFVNQSCLKVTRITRYHNIKSRIAIYLVCMKINMRNVKNHFQVIDRVSLKNWQTKWNRKSEN